MWNIVKLDFSIELSFPLDKMYAALKEFIGNGFSFGTDDEELFLRKV